MSTKRLLARLLIATLVLGLGVYGGFNVVTVQAQMQQASLYKRLGGYDAIAAVTDDFIGRMAADKILAKFFAGHSTDSLHRIRQLVVDQLCFATGGPCFYIGRSMKDSHQGMGIAEADWNTAVAHLVLSLDKFKVPEKEKTEFLTLASSLKKDIVNAPPGM